MRATTYTVRHPEGTVFKTQDSLIAQKASEDGCRVTAETMNHVPN